MPVFLNPPPPPPPPPLAISALKSKQLLQDAIKIFETLKEKGSFFISAIELDFDSDGEEIEKQIDEFLKNTSYDRTNLTGSN